MIRNALLCVRLLAVIAWLGVGFFRQLWLGAKQAIMIVVVLVVAINLPTVMKSNAATRALPPGPCPATDEIRAYYVTLEPWFWLMRTLAAVAVLLAVPRPERL